MSKEKKNKLISASVTAGVMALLFIFMLFCGFTHQVPPPPAKKVILIELDEEVGGGGGGGGNGGGGAQQQVSNQLNDAAEATSTENHIDKASSVSTATSEQTSKGNSNTNSQKVDTKALFPQGNNKGNSNGTNSGRNTGLGPDGNGPTSGPLGYGKGSRPWRGNPNISIPANESGKVYVEVEINEKGDVIKAYIASSKYSTTITSLDIKNKCIDAAKKVKYKEGKHELRIILFTNSGAEPVVVE